MNLFHELETHASHTALITERSERIGYGDLLGAADELGRKIAPRRLVFVLGRNNFESIAGYLGFARADAAQTLINYTIHDALLAKLLERYRPEFIYLPKARAASVKGAQIGALGDYVLLKTRHDREDALPKGLALLLTTSGSTGSPKLVRLSHENIASNAVAIGQSLGITGASRPMTTMPMSYSYGLSIINSHLAVGAAIVLSEATLMEKRFWDTMRTHGVTTLGGVPFIYEMLKKLRFERMELPHLEYITQAGGKLNPVLTAEFAAICARKGLRFYVMYGQTEATARISCLPWEHVQTKAGSIGVAIPGGELWLEDESGSRIDAPGTSGELIYKGRNVSLGYAESRRDLNAGDENKGLLRTGDLATRDAEGFFHIVGRKKRFLKVYGNRISLDEMEQLLRGAGFDCACAGDDDHLKIYTAGTADAARIRAYVCEHTGVSSSGLAIVSVDAIPRNESGKVLYAELDAGKA